MNETQTILLINNLAATLPSLIALYQTLSANRQGVKTIQELLADADATYQANLSQLANEQ